MRLKEATRCSSFEGVLAFAGASLFAGTLGFAIEGTPAALAFFSGGGHNKLPTEAGFLRTPAALELGRAPPSSAGSSPSSAFPAFPAFPVVATFGISICLAFPAFDACPAFAG